MPGIPRILDQRLPLAQGGRQQLRSAFSFRAFHEGLLVGLLLKARPAPHPQYRYSYFKGFAQGIDLPHQVADRAAIAAVHPRWDQDAPASEQGVVRHHVQRWGAINQDIIVGRLECAGNTLPRRRSRLRCPIRDCSARYICILPGITSKSSCRGISNQSIGVRFQIQQQTQDAVTVRAVDIPLEPDTAAEIRLTIQIPAPAHVCPAPPGHPPSE